MVSKYNPQPRVFWGKKKIQKIYQAGLPDQFHGLYWPWSRKWAQPHLYPIPVRNFFGSSGQALVRKFLKNRSPSPARTWSGQLTLIHQCFLPFLLCSHTAAFVSSSPCMLASHATFISMHLECWPRCTYDQGYSTPTMVAAKEQIQGVRGRKEMGEGCEAAMCII